MASTTPYTNDGFFFDLRSPDQYVSEERWVLKSKPKRDYYSYQFKYVLIADANPIHMLNLITKPICHIMIYKIKKMSSTPASEGRESY